MIHQINGLIGRRDVVHGIVSTLLLLPGCLSHTSSEDEDAAVVVEEVLIDNTEEEAHTLELELEYDDKILHDATHEIDAAEGNITGGKVVTVDLPEEPGEFVVRTAIGETTRERNIADRHGEGCISVQVLIENNGRPSILTQHLGMECLD